MKIKTFLIDLLFLSVSLLTIGCYHFYDIPKDEYLHSEDHSNAKILLDNQVLLKINKEEEILISSAYDSLFVKTDSSKVSIPIGNIVEIKQERLDIFPTIIFSLTALFVTLDILIYFFLSENAW